ncbi:hypothetical protein TCAL_12123 [Tigriopus californicus]|uniref:Endonuclease/exonuclease/phosphatase domain-containing protein n=1 Tax=Tigriopus californicus TaxID=6832 RepID=A0A553PDD8_TIGCA|nr:uncharacterized protein LOC131877237 [Tigriopus californicus]XP_059078836.1 uncharacterized protein LOC131877237 [Tigriopus californicus]TRY75701.1 hypothetical protein TCAL_12123 [Tigriopus californicus]|eukprot:TCALIF_12123-PA protein Name:"Protein of unknown function" AED:0.00 eAED:0.00 QI:53/1/1/1/0.66/0.75/4/36/252
MAEGRKSFKLATFNVHSFTDANGKPTFDKILQFVEDHGVDIICLQEAGKVQTERLMDNLKHFSANGLVASKRCSIVSKYKLEAVPRKYLGSRSSTRSVTARVLLEGNLSFILTCVHLNHISEGTRLSELNEITTNLHDLYSQSMTVIAGDFNALTLEDYSSDELNHITQVRANNRWERPKRALTDRMKQLGFTDTKTKVTEFSGILSTCRFKTRVDYIYLNKKFDDFFRIHNFTQRDVQASDHNIVISEVTY